MKKYFFNLGVAFSQLIHAFFGGDPKITTSSSLGRYEEKGIRFAELTCKLISFILMDSNHCKKIYENDKNHLQTTMNENSKPDQEI